MHRIGIACIATLLALGSTSARAGDATCERAALRAYGAIVEVDVRSVWACATAVARAPGSRLAERRCRRLRAVGIGLDRRSAVEVQRLRAACPDDARPPSLAAPRCESLDHPYQRMRLATCVVAASHCLAAQILRATLAPDLLEAVATQHPDNFDFDLGGFDGNRFSRCRAWAPASSTTTTVAGSATTTTLLAPTTTVTTTTTTAPAPTTTAPSPTTTLPEPPRLVVTEIHANPDALSDAAGEYFEVYNAGSASVDLAGLEISDDGSDAFTVQGQFLLEPGGFAVLGRSAAAADGTVDYVYGAEMVLANTADVIELRWQGGTVDRVSYDASYPLVAGASLALAPGSEDAAANDLVVSWCAETRLLANGDRGSPGRANSPCAALPPFQAATAP